MQYMLFIIIALISCSQEQGKGIEIKNAWIREAPPGATVAALYLEINNNGREDHLISINSPVSETAEIHSTLIDSEGTGKMVRIENVSVPHGEVLSFSPGGKHIMLIDLKEELKAGRSYEIILGFKNSGTKSVNAVVRGFNDGSHGNHNDHSMAH